MKIAVAALTALNESRISSYPLRAPFFLFFDESGGFIEAVDNPFKKAAAQKGYGIARLLSDNRVDALVTKKMQPVMANILNEAGIRVVETDKDTIDDIAAFFAPEPEVDTIIA